MLLESDTSLLVLALEIPIIIRKKTGIMTNLSDSLRNLRSTLKAEKNSMRTSMSFGLILLFLIGYMRERLGGYNSYSCTHDMLCDSKHTRYIM